MSWSAVSPSNIAFIKYMGKISHPCNQPDEKSPEEALHFEQLQKSPETTLSEYLHIPIDLASHLSKEDEELFWFKNFAINSSLSYTLKHFVTSVHIESSQYKDSWEPYKENPFKNKNLYRSSKNLSMDFFLSNVEQRKFLNFFQFLKRFFMISGYYTISSQNNFPKSIGSASSASSFSALTLAVYKLAREKSSLPPDKFKQIKVQELAHLSRVGSGSACRSLFSPWCLWEGYKINSLEYSWNHLLHQLILIDSKNKKISSTKAHHKIETSPQFLKRADRANKRLLALKASLNLEDWKTSFKICYEEFLDIHSLFESSKPPFSYRVKQTQKVLDYITQFWEKYKDGPLVTMDAGSNIHLFYRENQSKHREQILQDLSDFTILSSL
ncbi:MAG: hypothetical protein OXC37_06520 [Bdellovibrionaceae bacterium]|nr:hypothetical protein [Pseudobdellovibrionaceae bacterium]